MLRNLNVSTTGAAVIVSTQDALINFTGLVAGPLIRRFSYRKVTVIGAALVAIGILGTTTATTVAHILATYGVIVGIGVGLSSAATFVAISHYWSARRGQAVGISMAGAAIGFMMFPFLVRYLLEEYGFEGAILVLGGLTSNALCGAALLQPSEWHLIPADSSENEDKEVYQGQDSRDSHQPLLTRPRIDLTLVEEDEASEEAAPETPDSLPGRKLSVPIRPAMPSNTSVVSMAEELTASTNGRRASRTSNLPRKTSWVSMIDENAEKARLHGKVSANVASHLRRTSVISASALDITGSLLCLSAASQQEDRVMEDKTSSTASFKKPKKPSCLQRIGSSMDLDLLRNPQYVLVTFGLSLVWVAELHFKMVVPFFLSNLGIGKSDVAFCMSFTAISDILIRLILPPLCDRLKYKKRTLFFFTCVFLGISRSAMAAQTEWVPLLVTLVFCGLFRGATLINYQLTVAECVSLDRLPGAVGLHMVAKGVAVVALGPVLGYVRDASGSYALFLHAQTALMGLGLLSWLLEWIVLWVRSKNSKETTKEPIVINNSEQTV